MSIMLSIIVNSEAAFLVKGTAIVNDSDITSYTVLLVLEVVELDARGLLCESYFILLLKVWGTICCHFLKCLLISMRCFPTFRVLGK